MFRVAVFISFLSFVLLNFYWSPFLKSIWNIWCMSHLSVLHKYQRHLWLSTLMVSIESGPIKVFHAEDVFDTPNVFFRAKVGGWYNLPQGQDDGVCHRARMTISQHMMISWYLLYLFWPAFELSYVHAIMTTGGNWYKMVIIYKLIPWYGDLPSFYFRNLLLIYLVDFVACLYWLCCVHITGT